MNPCSESVSERASALSFDLFALPGGYFETPHIWHRQLRDHDPLHWNADGSVLLTRYDDVKAIWRDLRGLVDKREQFHKRFGDGPLLEHHTSTMLFRDPPDHDRLRAIVNPFFSTSSVRQLTEFVESLVDETLDAVTERRNIDFVKDFAFRIPISVICRILGVPREDGPLIHEMGQHILFPLNPEVDAERIERGNAAVLEFKAYLKDHVAHVRARKEIDPTEGVICAMLAAERAGKTISEDEIFHMCILMLNGGHETTTNLMAVSMHYLLDTPDQLKEFREHPEIAPTAIEELLRLVSPLQLQGRRTTCEVQVPSGTIPPNTEVILCQASANRDERVFEDPEKMNLRRAKSQHLAFGAGIHVCIGRPLARLEASIALPKVLQRFSSIERNGSHRFNRNVRFRGLEVLPVTLSGAQN